jgi:hypothetical protein
VRDAGARLLWNLFIRSVYLLLLVNDLVADEIETCVNEKIRRSGSVDARRGPEEGRKEKRKKQRTAAEPKRRLAAAKRQVAP